MMSTSKAFSDLIILGELEGACHVTNLVLFIEANKLPAIALVSLVCLHGKTLFSLSDWVIASFDKRTVIALFNISHIKLFFRVPY